MLILLFLISSYVKVFFPSLAKEEEIINTSCPRLLINGINSFPIEPVAPVTAIFILML
jgi:competence protein ComGC